MELKKEKKAGKGKKGNAKNKIDGRRNSCEGKERRKWGVMYEMGKESREGKERRKWGVMYEMGKESRERKERKSKK